MHAASLTVVAGSYQGFLLGDVALFAFMDVPLPLVPCKVSDYNFLVSMVLTTSLPLIACLCVYINGCISERRLFPPNNNTIVILVMIVYIMLPWSAKVQPNVPS